MGLGINKQVKGFETKYASIIGLDYDKFQDKTEIRVALYKDEITMKNNVKDFIKILSFKTNDEINRPQAYAALKNETVVGFAGSDYFKDTTDVGIDN